MSRGDMRLAKRLARRGAPVDGLLWAANTWLGRRVRMRVRPLNHDILVRTGSPDVEVALSCFEGEFDQVLKAMPKLRHQLIVDAGGYIGTAAIVFAEAYPEATIVTLEPSTENFALLKENVAKYPNIHPLNKALTPEPGVLELRNRGTGQWGFTVVARPADNPDGGVLEQVQCTTLGEIMAEHGFDGIGILKLDIEGGEHALLSRETGWIARTDAICIELHDRIVGGCSDLYHRAVEGRFNSKMPGEKYLSLSQELLA